MLVDGLVQGADDAVAIVRADGHETTYATLAAATSELGDRLRGAGAEPGKIVGVACADSYRFIVAALAIWRCGAAVLPVVHRMRSPWIDATLRRAGALATVVDRDGTIDIDRHENPASIDPAVGLVLFTSGSSAAPKAVALGASGVVANVTAILRYLPLATHRRTGVVVPLSYSYGLVGQVLTTLHVGGTIVLLHNLAYATLQLDAMRRLDVRGLSSVPTSLRQLARAAIERPEGERPRLGYVASAGGPLDSGTIDLIHAAFPAATLFNQYGLTEASPRVTAISDDDPKLAAGSVGRAIRDVEVWASSESGERLPAGSEGELVVHGPSVMLGYLGDPIATAHVLSVDRALRTGDAGHVDAEGYVYVAGRLDGVVKCAGERVSVEEVAVALRAVNGVIDAYVIGVPHDELGTALHGYIETQSIGREELLSRVRTIVRKTLPPAKRPTKLVALDALPRTSNGKVARSELMTMSLKKEPR